MVVDGVGDLVLDNSMLVGVEDRKVLCNSDTMRHIQLSFTSLLIGLGK